ncbi:MAG: serine/threonine protein kinase [Thermoanaerobaculia bacterium]|nr:serine/threonine protein kinase [Thermoanaerobaculia bacterium]
MTPEQWEQLKAVFQEVLDRAPEQRRQYLDEACRGDSGLRRQVESLIASSEQPEVLETPAPREPSDAALGAERPSHVGKRIGPYKVLAEIGHGGMGSVYLARRSDEQFRQRVAVKIVRPGMESDIVLRRFRNERQILAGLDHPHIARLLDGGATEEGLPFFVLEYVEGQPLLEYCDSHRLSVDERLKLFRTICSAVHYAHQNLVVHRDIKPGNILVTSEGAPKLLDFGIAKLLNPEFSSQTLDYTAASLRLLTPDYASPEQIRGEPITTASDVYSLGVVLYELLTGHRPYRLETLQAAELLRVVCEKEPEKPSTAVSRVEEVLSEDGSVRSTLTPESVSQTRGGEPQKLQRRLAGDLDNIVLMAMRKEPQRRYASVEQFSEDIRRHLERLPVIARKDTLGYRTGKFVRRHRAGVVAAALVAGALVAGLAATVHQARVAQSERARAERRFNDVRQLANAFLFEVHDGIQKLPGSTKVRETLVTKALVYLDSLSREAAGDRSLRRELATAYLKVGDVQGRPAAANLGDTTGALKSYRKSVELREALAAEDPGNPEDRRELAVAYDRVAEVTQVMGDRVGALALSRKALSIHEKLAAERPGDPIARRDVAIGHHHVAVALVQTGDQPGATASYRKEMEIFEALWRENLKDPKSQRNAALGYKYYGSALQAGKDYAGARDMYLRAVRLDEERSQADPTNAEARLDLSFDYASMGGLLWDLENYAGSLQSHRRALAIRETLVAADPRNAQLRGVVARAHGRIGAVLLKMGDTAGALESRGKEMAIYGDLSKGDPTNVFTRASAARAVAGLGSLHATLGADGKTPAARRVEHWRRARSQYRQGLEAFLEMRQAGTLPTGETGEPDRILAEIARCDEALSRLEGAPGPTSRPKRD